MVVVEMPDNSDSENEEIQSNNEEEEDSAVNQELEYLKNESPSPPPKVSKKKHPAFSLRLRWPF